MRTNIYAGSALRRWRERAQLSQAQLAERIDSGQSHISEIETGATDVCLSTLARCFEALGLELVITAVPKDRESKK
jgi:transcriptional regulator with XRE-family HTH domain